MADFVVSIPCVIETEAQCSARRGNLNFAHGSVLQVSVDASDRHDAETQVNVALMRLIRLQKR